jgi:hypothetical protein
MSFFGRPYNFCRARFHNLHIPVFLLADKPGLEFLLAGTVAPQLGMLFFLLYTVSKCGEGSSFHGLISLSRKRWKF